MDGEASFSVLETNGYVHVLYDGYSPLISTSMQWSRFSKTTYQIIPFTSTVYNTSAASTAPLLTGSYAAAASSVTSAAFYPNSTSTQGWKLDSPTAAQILAASQVLATLTSVEYTQAVSLSNGNVVVAWSGYDTNNSVTLYSCKYVIFNSEGNIIRPPTVLGTETTSSATPQISMAVMPGGKFTIFYKGIYVLNASGSVQAFTSIASIAISANLQPSISALSGDRVVVLYYTSGSIDLRYAVYDQNLTLLAGPNIVSSTSNTFGFSVSTSGSTLNFIYQNGTTASYPNTYDQYSETSTNTWTRTSSVAITTGITDGIKSFGLNSGLTLYLTHDASNTGTLRTFYDNGQLNAYSISNTVTPTNARSPVQIGCTSSGNYVVAALGISNLTFGIYYYWANSSSNINVTTVTHDSNSGAAFTPALASLCGERMLMAYVSQVSGQKMVLRYTVFTPGVFQGTDTFTAGSTASGRVTPLTNANGYSLVGVATSSAAPGGTGTITINGSATLNSNYFFASPGQSFDFSNPIRFGAVGSVIERNVSLQGN
jgi:hypothetical protein